MRCMVVASIVLFCINVACGQTRRPCKLVAILSTSIVASYQVLRDHNIAAK